MNAIVVVALNRPYTFVVLPILILLFRALPASKTPTYFIPPPQGPVVDASSVPVLDLQIAADNMTPSDIYNVASNLIRPALVSVPGVAIPAPYGGAPQDVEVDLDQTRLLEHGLSATDVGRALASQNIVLRAGDQKIDAIDYMVATNASPLALPNFNTLPIKQLTTSPSYLQHLAF